MASKPMAWNKFGQLGKVTLVAALGLFFVFVLAVVDVEGEASQDRIIERQDQLNNIKSRLISIDKRLLLTRQTELRLLVGGGRIEERGVLEKEIKSILRETQQLRNTLTDPELVERVRLTERITRKYADSVLETFAAREKLGWQGRSGLLAALRSSEDHIFDLLAEFNDFGLSDAFTRICLLERDFASSLNMQLTDSMKKQNINLQESLKQEPFKSRSSQILQALSEYDQKIDEIVKAIVALELLTAHNTLQFDRLLPNISECQRLLDLRIGASVDELKRLRRSSLIKTVWVFSIILVLFGVFTIVEFQQSRQLVRRLRQLAIGMSEIGKGNFEANLPLPKGKDEVGTLTNTFIAMSDQIKEQIAIIEEERQRAENANLTKSQFLANMSHEIRTPMNGVLGMLELLEHTNMNMEQAEYVRTLRGSGQALLTIINDILDYSKIESGMVTLEPRAFEVRNWLNEKIALFQPKAREKSLVLHQSVTDEVPRFLLGDHLRLGQVMTNLLGNALKFTEQGSVSVDVRVLSTSAAGVDLEIIVSDTGIGMSREESERIFQPFVQADSSTTRRYGGTGLGLPITRMLVEHMNGRIWVESQPKIGSRFYVNLCLPEVTPDETALNLVQLPTHYESLPIDTYLNPVPMEILVVEDNVVNQKVALRMLKKIGYRADLANDGFEGVEMAKEKFYDLIFMDIHMPRMDGLQAARQILRHYKSGRKPVIVALTANAYNTDRDACLDVGMHDFVSKPFKLQKLQDVLEKWSAVATD